MIFHANQKAENVFNSFSGLQPDRGKLVNFPKNAIQKTIQFLEKLFNLNKWSVRVYANLYGVYLFL